MRILLLFLFLSLFTDVISQNIGDTITLSSNFRGFVFIHNGEQIKAKDVLQLMEYNEVAYDEFSASRESYIFGNIFSMIGTVLIVYPFVNSAIGNEPNYGPAFAGVCFVGISVPIFMSYNKKTISSIIQYNSGLALPLEPSIQSSLYFGETSSGIGFRYVY